jgi:iron complex transport system substrate-binding protein
MRIVSLLASGTEIAVALGAENELVGISHECDYPESIRKRPVLTVSMIDSTATSKSINNEVKGRLLNSLSLYHIKTDLLAKLKPEVIITQEQCKVCAVSFVDLQEAMKPLVDVDVKIVSLNPMSLDEIYNDIVKVSIATRHFDEGKALIQQMKERVRTMQEKTKTLPKKRVLFIEWMDPIMLGGNWMPSLIEAAGGENLLTKAGEHSRVFTFSEIVSANPDVIVISPCGFKLPQTERELNILRTHEPWPQLNAVKADAVFIADGNEYFNRSGPRIMESMEMLAAMIHPDHFADLAEKHAGRYRQVLAEEKILN